MVTKKEILKKYGKKLGNKILKDTYMTGITVTILPDGDYNIPQSDVIRALRHIEDEKFEDGAWD